MVDAAALRALADELEHEGEEMTNDRLAPSRAWGFAFREAASRIRALLDTPRERCGRCGGKGEYCPLDSPPLERGYTHTAAQHDAEKRPCPTCQPVDTPPAEPTHVHSVKCIDNIDWPDCTRAETESDLGPDHTEDCRKQANGKWECHPSCTRAEWWHKWHLRDVEDAELTQVEPAPTGPIIAPSTGACAICGPRRCKGHVDRSPAPTENTGTEGD